MKYDFDATQVQPAIDVTCLPAGWYPVVVTATEMRQTSAGTGAYLQATLRVVDGPHKNHIILHRMNVQNPNPTAVEMANRVLSALCHAMHKLRITDTEELHGTPVEALLTVQPPRQHPTTGESYGASNDVRTYRSLAPGAAPAAPVPTQQPAQQTTWQPPTAAPHAPAWAGPPQQPPPQPVPQQAPAAPPPQQAAPAAAPPAAAPPQAPAAPPQAPAAPPQAPAAPKQPGADDIPW